MNQGNGLELLRSLPTNSVKLVFFDPQYEKASKVSRAKDWPLSYQNATQIQAFLKEISRVLKLSGFCLLWINKALLISSQILAWLRNIDCLKIVDLLIWAKPHFGFGSYFRNQAEFAFLIQKHPPNSKLFKDRSFGNVYQEKQKMILLRVHPHEKPVALNKRLIEAVTEKGDLVVDPCAGGFGILRICLETGREFLGTDLNYFGIREFMVKAKKNNHRKKKAK
ncbi:MAG: adenine-specific DNA methylase [Mycoplasmataceae bacterium CE_OT135]|nr:MAG: adenine-specific DNA methylase [Mycoplasmataceae bacterium CE_OT135]